MKKVQKKRKLDENGKSDNHNHLDDKKEHRHLCDNLCDNLAKSEKEVNELKETVRGYQIKFQNATSVL